MATAVIMPQMGYEMTEGAVQNWIKKEGDYIQKGEKIAEIEADKTTIELEALASGTLRKIVVELGVSVPINTVIAIIGEQDEIIDWASFGLDKPGGSIATPTPVATAEPLPLAATPTPVPASVAVAYVPERNGAATTFNRVTEPTPTTTPGSAGRILSSPIARKIANELGLDISQIKGTGPSGRVKGADVKNYAASVASASSSTPLIAAAVEISTPPPPNAVAAPVVSTGSTFEERNLSRMRQTIARRMTEAKQQVPHFYITTEIDMGQALKLRQTINAELEKEGGAKVSVNDLVIKAVAKVLKKYPAINSSFQGTKLRLNQDINIAVAVALEEGLITPVIQHADQKSISQIAVEARTLAEKARKGTIHPEEFSGGTFTISNLGMYDVTNFGAIINQPQAAILAVASIKPVVVLKSGSEEEGNLEFGVVQQMAVTISVDHRATDGAVAAQFLQELKRTLQNPFSLLV